MNNTNLRTIYRYAAISACFLSLFVLGGLSANAGAIVAGNVTIDITGTNTESGVTMSDHFEAEIQGDGSFDLPNSNSITPMWQAFVNANGNVDPIIGFGFGATNALAVPVEFTFTIGLPIAAIPIGTLHGGSTGGSVSDSSGDGVGGVTPFTTVPGLPFYAGQIDGATVLSIYPDPFALPIPAFAGFGDTKPIPILTPGLPGPTLPSGPALLSIGIVHKFTLSPGDSIGTSSTFLVEPVPEPSAIALAVIGGAGLLVWARRRRRK